MKVSSILTWQWIRDIHDKYNKILFEKKWKNYKENENNMWDKKVQHQQQEVITGYDGMYCQSFTYRLFKIIENSITEVANL